MLNGGSFQTNSRHTAEVRPYSHLPSYQNNSKSNGHMAQAGLTSFLPPDTLCQQQQPGYVQPSTLDHSMNGSDHYGTFPRRHTNQQLVAAAEVYPVC